VSAQLDDLVPGSVIGGVVPAKNVTSVALSWHGGAAVTRTCRDPDGRVGERLLYRSDEEALQVRGSGVRWSFDADGELLSLVSEARRMGLAHLFDPLLAVHLSLVEPLPHQIRAVYGELLPRQPLRFVLADDPGAGKTIMAGLYIKELLLRADVARCLIVAPGGLVAQWQDELSEKFSLGFDIRSIDTDGHLLLIEVKGHIEGSTTVTVTRNEILTGLNTADHYLLALVEVRTDGTCQVRHLRDPFAGKSPQLHFAERSTTFDWNKLWETAETPR